jgi:hypothetical protein
MQRLDTKIYFDLIQFERSSSANFTTIEKCIEFFFTYPSWAKKKRCSHHAISVCELHFWIPGSACLLLLLVLAWFTLRPWRWRPCSSETWSYLWTIRSYSPEASVSEYLVGNCMSCVRTLHNSFFLRKSTKINLKNVIFWDMAPWRSCVNRRFGETYRLHL